MLSRIGVDSFYVVINSERGSVTPKRRLMLEPSTTLILAIKLPPNVSDPSLVATVQHPRLGTLLYFDPDQRTDPVRRNWRLSAG